MFFPVTAKKRTASSPLFSENEEIAQQGIAHTDAHTDQHLPEGMSHKLLQLHLRDLFPVDIVEGIEDLRKDQKTPFKELCNRAVNMTLSRTVITSLTTLFAVLALFCFGDGSIFDFALTMLIGIVAGTYSSLFIAMPVMIWWYRGKRPQFDKEESRQQG